MQAFGTIRYDYDTQDRLKRAGNRSYNYDADGNRTYEYFTEEQWDTSVDDLNVRVEESTLYINGKGNGNGIWKQNGDANPISQKQETWSAYEYRADNRMTSYKDSQGEHWLYRYDGLGRRHEKERLASAHPEKDVWKYDRTWYAGTSHSVLAELTDIEKWNDKTIQTGLKYLLGPGGRAYGSQETYIKNGKEWNPASWSNRRYYHYDRLGSVTAISLDKPGVAGEYYEYGPFGEILKGTHKWGWEHNGNYHMGFDSIGYTGTRIDAESGNYHFPFREYDPLTSQWTTSDPIKDGDLWYGYVNSNPVKYIDPLGLEIGDIVIDGLQDVLDNKNSIFLTGDKTFSYSRARNTYRPNTLNRIGCNFDIVSRIALSHNIDKITKNSLYYGDSSYYYRYQGTQEDIIEHAQNPNNFVVYNIKTNTTLGNYFPDALDEDDPLRDIPITVDSNSIGTFYEPTLESITNSDWHVSPKLTGSKMKLAVELYDKAIKKKVYIIAKVTNQFGGSHWIGITGMEGEDFTYKDSHSFYPTGEWNWEDLSEIRILTPHDNCH